MVQNMNSGRGFMISSKQDGETSDCISTAKIDNNPDIHNIILHKNIKMFNNVFFASSLIDN
jgi:hypothetical protein